MNKNSFIVFIIIFVLFIIAMFLMGKISIKNVLTTYLRNYFSNAYKEEKRKFNIFYFIFLGIVPYALGVLLFLSFQNVFLTFDVSILIQIDIVLLTIFCLFIGLDFKKDGKESVKNELVATLLINIGLIAISIVLLLLADSFYKLENTNTAVVLYSIYYAISFKIFVLFLYSLKRVFILRKA